MRPIPTAAPTRMLGTFFGFIPSMKKSTQAIYAGQAGTLRYAATNSVTTTKARTTSPNTRRERLKIIESPSAVE
jgi:hypothetical protein